MAVHRVTKILPWAPDQLAALVADVRAYPEFVPWVTAMRTWSPREEAPGVSLIDAEAAVGFSFLKERFSTWVRHDRNRDMVEVGREAGRLLLERLRGVSLPPRRMMLPSRVVLRDSIAAPRKA